MFRRGLGTPPEVNLLSKTNVSRRNKINLGDGRKKSLLINLQNLNKED